MISWNYLTAWYVVYLYITLKYCPLDPKLSTYIRSLMLYIFDKNLWITCDLILIEIMKARKTFSLANLFSTNFFIKRFPLKLKIFTVICNVTILYFVVCINCKIIAIRDIKLLRCDRKLILVLKGYTISDFDVFIKWRLLTRIKIRLPAICKTW